ncbi:Tripartite-type tricarboxylate transporter, receptor component TctC [Bradyrhizobium sp. NFR13]|uniref:Bug family tripartite tricarboxylate transporter substrate binding protein n=1 Tax=Bradyrhizobium sp. NFR13 TaxID=1566285 RepID=UPI0008E7025F|nr:tripartite tricarboxylate transporter substrate-binding protein [Bradyrhizobium sp. NFR13]SFL31723.1 Tripartite-type tricarboxylate transporter, receptor component TctC [Bradyrhizobium sp. NFR13]
MNKFVRWSGVVAGLLLCTAAHADTTWPTRLIKATIPFGPGSATDVVPRIFFERLGPELGQTIVVENRVGGGGAVGTAAVAKAEPDGYSVLAHSSALTITPAINASLPYDTSKDLSSVIMIGVSPQIMIVPKERPWKTVDDFLKGAKAKGSSINFGSVGIGSAVHISAEKFRMAGGFEATHIPYRGGPEVIADILGGRIDFYFCPAATALPLIREGQVRALVVSTEKRTPELPDVPSLAEVGLKDGVSNSWIGVFVPSKTPREIVDKMRDAGLKVLAKPEMQAALTKIGVEPMPMEPKAMDELVAKEVAANIALLKNVK